MIKNNYRDFCENLFFKWKEDKLFIENNFGFDLSALPEPYLTFGENVEEISFLTTNPGGVMNFQRKPSDFLIKGGNYHELSKRLASHYFKTLTNAAKTRIQNMYDASNILISDKNGFTQFEISPFHSSSFPNKEKFSRYVLNNKSNIHHEYISLLTEKIEGLNCICIQSGFPDLGRLNKKWFELISSIMSVDKNEWKPIYFKYKNERATTGAFYFKKKNVFKVILFNSAGNSFPKLNTMEQLFNILKK